MLYVDNQPGVGFSYSMTHSDYDLDTSKLVADVLRFLDLFFAEYQEFSANRFFLAGDGYAGILIPHVATAILDRNDLGQAIINLKGYLLGNPSTDPSSEFAQMPVLAAQKSLLPPGWLHTYHSVCSTKPTEPAKVSEPACHDLLESAWRLLRGLSPYNLQEDCWTAHSAAEAKGVVFSYPFAVHEVLSRTWPWQTPWPGESGSSSTSKQFTYSTMFGSHAPKGSLPCVDTRIAPLWFNMGDVRKYLHATVHSKLNFFQMCSSQGALLKAEGSMAPMHKQLVERDLRVLIYSGDQDLVVPYLSTYAWVSKLGLPLLHNWTNWWYHNGQTGGFLVQYEGLMFATIRGGGHMAAASQPHKALTLFARFVSGKPVSSMVKERIRR